MTTGIAGASDPCPRPPATPLPQVAWRFERILASPWPEVAATHLKNLANLLLDERRDASRPVILGTLGDRRITLTRGRLAKLVVALARRVSALGLQAGDTACVMRMPSTSETLVAVTYAALTAAGVRVLLPMYAEEGRFRGWLRRAQVRAVLWSEAETRALGDREATDRLERWKKVAREERVPTWCFDRDLGLLDLLERRLPPVQADDVEWLLGSSSHTTEGVIFTTSGTSGLSKLVVYSHGAILRCCAAWEQAGLFRRERHGGPGLCLLFSHSMGVRAFWNAVWSGQPLCLIPPEWFSAHPERVRALLNGMKPTHVTGGPGVLRALLEMARVFADLGQTGLARLRTAVNVGAPFDPELAERFLKTTGTALENGFGMTETMQVTATALGGRPAPAALGTPLPGVRLGLRPADEVSGDTFELYVSSPFGASRYLGDRQEGDLPEYLPTGDLVSWTDGGLTFAGRARQDFFNDSVGLKIPRRRVAGFYSGLGALVEHIELFPLRHEPGLAALLFLGDRGRAEATGEPITGEPVRRVKALLEGCNARLFETLCPTEFRHMTVARFCCVGGEPPRTAKGTVQRGLLETELSDVIARLVGEETRGGGVHHTDRAKYLVPAFVRLTSPRRGQLLRLARLDKRFTGGKGDLLTYTEDGQQHTVLDFVGGFGTSLLGHRHPEVVAAAADFIAGDGVFLSDQGSLREPEATLAEKLGRFVGQQTGDSYVVRFGSTGSEAVEMAVAHALLEQEQVLRRHERRLKQRFGATHPDLVRRCIDENRARWAGRRPVLLAIEGGYHGNSLAARCTSGRVRRWEPFEGAVAIETISLPPDGDIDLDATLAECELTLETLAWQGDQVVETTTSVSRVFAAIAEPVLGEGGVRTVSTDLLEGLANRPFPLVSDEIQCGLGRCGAAVASMPVRADYYLVGKALGGGIAKISALLVESSRYLGRFDALYGSTFAGDAFSSTIASRVLDVIEEEQIVLRCAQRGQRLRDELEGLSAKHPALLRRVGGRGLLLGVELDPAGVSDSLILRALEAQRRLGVVVAAYLLDHHGLRLLPTLSAPNVLRIEPSAFLDDDAIAKLVGGLDDVCQRLASRDLATLLGFLVRDDLRTTPVDAAGPPVPALSTRVEAPPERAVRVAFINHFAHPETELVAVEPSLSALPRAVRRTLFHRLAEATELKPLVAFRRNLFGGRVSFASIVVPADVAMLEHWHRSGDHRLVRRRIQEAVDLAGQLGCEVITLGGYTSIVTDNGRTITPPPGARVTTGNTLTVAVGGERIRRACAALEIDPQDPDSVLAIVGATGNIGRALAQHMLTGPGRFRRALLMGRSSARLEALRHQLSEVCSVAWDDGDETPPQIEMSTDPAALKSARVIAVATNTNAPIVQVGHLRSRRAVLVADLSVPKAVSGEARRLPNVRVIPLAGTVAVPGESAFRIAPHIEPGTAFCCAAEALLLGLDQDLGREWSLRGAIEPAAVRALGAAAERAGFLERLCEAARPVT